MSYPNSGKVETIVEVTFENCYKKYWIYFRESIFMHSIHQQASMHSIHQVIFPHFIWISKQNYDFSYDFSYIFSSFSMLFWVQSSLLDSSGTSALVKTNVLLHFCCILVSTQKSLIGTGAEENFDIFNSNSFHLFWQNYILKTCFPCLQNMWRYMNHKENNSVP